MIPTFLISGAIKCGIATVLSGGVSMFASKKLGNLRPDKVYAYKTKKNKYIGKIITTLLFFVPVVGTIELGLSVLGSALIVGETIYFKKKPREAKEAFNKVLSRDYEMPDERLKKLKDGTNAYNGIQDSLKLEGLSEDEFKKEIKEARLVNPYVKDNNGKEIKKNETRVNNLELLDEMKDYLKDPKKAYKYTVNKRIEYADVDDDKLILGVSKGEEKSKILVKKFKLR